MELAHGAQTTYQIGYHMVWGVKYCHHVLNNKMKEFLVAKTKEICEAYEYQYMCMGIAPNHVHLFIGAPPKVAPAQIAQRIKSITARELYRYFPQLKRQLYGGAIWKDGYYVGTVGEGQTEDKVRGYIDKQGRHTKNEMKQLKLYF
jgi:putative transposase